MFKKYKLKTAWCQDKELLNTTFYYHLIEIKNYFPSPTTHEGLTTRNPFRRSQSSRSHLEVNEEKSGDLLFVDDGPDGLTLEGLGDIPLLEAIDDLNLIHYLAVLKDLKARTLDD